MSSERKVKVILHGALKKLYPHELVLSGHNVAEIINGMCKLTKAFDVPPGKEKHTISVLGYDCHEALNDPLKDDVEELHLVPAMVGGKSGGFARIIIGAVLIAAAFVAPFAGAVAFGTTTWGSLLFSAGMSLALGGLLELMSPQPKADTFGNNEADPEASKYLGATQNTVKIGTRIPLLYGEILAYGHYLSFDVDAVDVAT